MKIEEQNYTKEYLQKMNSCRRKKLDSRVLEKSGVRELDSRVLEAWNSRLDSPRAGLEVWRGAVDSRTAAEQVGN